jgi:hypothetical protein
MVQASSRWIDKRPVAFVLAYGAVLLGVWAEFDGGLGTALGKAVANLVSVFKQRSLKPLVDEPHVRTLVFCILLLVIATLLWKRLKADDRKQDERTLGVLRALYRVPNISVVRQYAEDYWPGFLRVLQENWPDDELSATERKEATARMIRDALAIIIAMTQQFARGEDARYGANVMLAIARDDSEPEPFPKKFVENLRFHSHGALNDLAGLLYLPDELVVANLPGKEDRTIARIVLPIPYEEKDSRGRRLVIPGAPAAVLRGGGPSVHEDTRMIATECADFAAPIRDEIAEYFSENGEGRHVLSFASLRLGNDLEPIGVLNIDSDRTHVLGQEDEFYVSFYALIRPMIDHLADAVTEYAALLGPEIANMSEEGRASASPGPLVSASEMDPAGPQPGSGVADTGVTG